jgi:hypothetical protein
MAHESSNPVQRAGKAARVTGWVLSGLIAVFIGSGGINALRGATFVVAGVARFGYPASSLTGMGIAELLCAVLFLIPRTAALGAILFTGFFGGAVATHARVGDPTWPIPVVFALLVWIALLLRDPRFHIIRPSRYENA